MTALLGILGAAALFALMGYAATRVGSRLGSLPKMSTILRFTLLFRIDRVSEA